MIPKRQGDKGKEFAESLPRNGEPPGGFPQRRYGPPLTISVTAKTNSGWSHIDSAFLGLGCL